jgi:hypothetical protein
MPFVIGSVDSSPYLVSSGWSRENGAFEVWERKALGPIGVVPSPPRPTGFYALVEISAACANGVSAFRYYFKSIPPAAVQGGDSVRAFVVELPIYKHPKFDLMFAWYGRSNMKGRVEWSRYDPGVPSVERDGRKIRFKACPNDDSGPNNPMLGVQAYLCGRVEYEKSSYINYRLGAGSVDKIGCIDRPPVLSFRRNKWIRSGLKISSYGSGYRVTDVWLLNNLDNDVEWDVQMKTDRLIQDTGEGADGEDENE